MTLRSGWERISQTVLGTVDSHWLKQIKWPSIGRDSYLLSNGLEVRTGEDFVTSPGNRGFHCHWFQQIKWPPIGPNSYFLGNGLEVRMGEDFATSLGTVSSHWFEQIKWPPIGRNSYFLGNGLEVRSWDGGFSLVRTNKMASYWSKLLPSRQWP